MCMGMGMGMGMRLVACGLRLEFDGPMRLPPANRPASNLFHSV